MLMPRMNVRRQDDACDIMKIFPGLLRECTRCLYIFLLYIYFHNSDFYVFRVVEGVYKMLGSDGDGRAEEIFTKMDRSQQHQQITTTIISTTTINQQVTTTSTKIPSTSATTTESTIQNIWNPSVTHSLIQSLTGRNNCQEIQ